MKRNLLLSAASWLVLAVAAPLMAHHSFAAEYDSKKPVKLKGVVTKVDWMNPHVYFYMDVTDDSGTANWGLEMGPPNGLQRSGWNKNTIKIGDEITVEGTLAKDGSKQANVRSVILTITGQRLGGGSSEGKNPD
jgi:hypothetical protein